MPGAYAALMGNSGVILAFDRQADRLVRLQNNAEKTGAHSISARCQDFLQLDPKSSECSAVQAILLDPSCSGSGTVCVSLTYMILPMPSQIAVSASITHILLYRSTRKSSMQTR